MHTVLREVKCLFLNYAALQMEAYEYVRCVQGGAQSQIWETTGPIIMIHQYSLQKCLHGLGTR